MGFALIGSTLLIVSRRFLTAPYTILSSIQDYNIIFLSLSCSLLLLPLQLITSSTQLGLIWGGSHRSWNAPVVISSLTLGFVFSIAFIVWEWKGTKHPLVPSKSIMCLFLQRALYHQKHETIIGYVENKQHNISEYRLTFFAPFYVTVHIFKFRMVNGACLTMAINGWLFLTQIYYIPTFFQLAYGYSAIKAGALLLPLTLVQSKLVAGFLLRTPLLLTLDAGTAFSSTLSGLIVSWRGRYRVSYSSIPLSNYHSTGSCALSIHQVGINQSDSILTGKYITRLGPMGSWTGSLLNARQAFKSWQADRLSHFDGFRCWTNTPTVSPPASPRHVRRAVFCLLQRDKFVKETEAY